MLTLIFVNLLIWIALWMMWSNFRTEIDQFDLKSLSLVVSSQTPASSWN